MSRSVPAYDQQDNSDYHDHHRDYHFIINNIHKQEIGEHSFSFKLDMIIMIIKEIIEIIIIILLIIIINKTTMRIASLLKHGENGVFGKWL